MNVLTCLSDRTIDTTTHNAAETQQQDIGDMSVAEKLMVCSPAIYFLALMLLLANLANTK